MHPNQEALKSKTRTMADRHLKAKEFLNTNEIQTLGLYFKINKQKYNKWKYKEKLN